MGLIAQLDKPAPLDFCPFGQHFVPVRPIVLSSFQLAGCVRRTQHIMSDTSKRPEWCRSRHHEKMYLAGVSVRRVERHHRSAVRNPGELGDGVSAQPEDLAQSLGQRRGRAPLVGSSGSADLQLLVRRLAWTVGRPTAVAAGRTVMNEKILPLIGMVLLSGPLAAQESVLYNNPYNPAGGSDCSISAACSS